MSFWLIVALAVFAAPAALYLFLRPTSASNPAYDVPCEFQYDGANYWWVPDEASVPFFADRFEYGSFLYEDGTPVTDLVSERLLRVEWLEQCHRAESRREFHG